MSIKLKCEDEQNYGFERLEAEGDANERFMLSPFKPLWRWHKQLTQEDIEALIY